MYGKLKESYWKDSILEYTKRLSKYAKITIIEVPDEKNPDKPNFKLEQEIKEKEGFSIIKQIKKDSYVIALDLKGKSYSSEEFSKKIEDISLYNSHITFIIGGSLGLSNDVILKSNESICFSKMTFPHQLMRVILLEQIYRAFKIANNEIYHK